VPILGYLVPLAGGDPIPLAKEKVVIGRRDGCDIRLAAANVSGRHAEIRKHKNKWVVIDLESANGTRVNGAKVKSKTLANGDEIVFARKHTFRLELDPKHAPPPAADDVAPSSSEFDNDADDGNFKKPLLEKAGLAKKPVQEFSGDEFDSMVDSSLDSLLDIGEDADSMIDKDSMLDRDDEPPKGKRR
jgi:hypothetical protein